MCDCIKNFYNSEIQKNTPTQIWNLYAHQNRAYIKDFFVYGNFDITKCYPDIQCIYFHNLDRGIQSWKIFNNALKTIFPNLKSLFLTQNYSLLELENEFIEFFEDPWIDNIWIVDFQSKYKCIQKEMKISMEKIRVFDTYELYYNEDEYYDYNEDGYSDYNEEKQQKKHPYFSNDLIDIDLNTCIIFHDNDLLLKIFPIT
jgi:hypothetical protein